MIKKIEFFIVFIFFQIPAVICKCVRLIYLFIVSYISKERIRHYESQFMLHDAGFSGQPFALLFP